VPTSDVGSTVTNLCDVKTYFLPYTAASAICRIKDDYFSKPIRLQHVKRMEHSRILRIVLEYKPNCKRDIDRPKTSWRDQQHLQD
jgi:hypothetical protein